MLYPFENPIRTALTKRSESSKQTPIVDTVASQIDVRKYPERAPVPIFAELLSVNQLWSVSIEEISTLKVFVKSANPAGEAYLKRRVWVKIPMGVLASGSTYKSRS